jgi:hypothetical protein
MLGATRAAGILGGIAGRQRAKAVQMSVLAFFRWKGDSEQLLRAYDTELEHPVAWEQPRRRAHVCAGTADGMAIVDVWEFEEDFRAMMDDSEFQRNLHESGTPEPDTLDVWNVHASIP